MKLTDAIIAKLFCLHDWKEVERKDKGYYKTHYPDNPTQPMQREFSCVYSLILNKCIKCGKMKKVKL